MTPTVVAIVIVILIASVFQGSIGFGGNLIAQPIVIQLDPDLAPGPTLLTMTVLSGLLLMRDSSAANVGALGPAGFGTVIGTAIALIVVRQMGASGLSVVVAVAILVMVAITALSTTIERTRRNLSIAGALGGFGATTAGIGGPPIALLYQGATGHEVRGFLSSYNLLVSLFAIAGLSATGLFGSAELRDTALLLPVMAVGFWSSKPLLPIVDRGATRPAILLVSALAAVILLVRSF